LPRQQTLALLLLLGDGLLLVLHGGPKLAFFLFLHGAAAGTAGST
jgi:hypothetical protein